jgi:hypothetical protein
MGHLILWILLFPLQHSFEYVMLPSFRELNKEWAVQLCNLMGFRTSRMEYMAIFKKKGGAIFGTFTHKQQYKAGSIKHHTKPNVKPLHL